MTVQTAALVGQTLLVSKTLYLQTQINYWTLAKQYFLLNQTWTTTSGGASATTGWSTTGQHFKYWVSIDENALVDRFATKPRRITLN